MKLYFDNSTPQKLLGSRSVEEELAMGSFPGATSVFEFDESTNAALVLAASQFPNGVPRVTFSSGVPRIDDTPFAINPDGPVETDRKALPSRKAQIETYMGLSDLLWPGDLPGTATLPQVIARLNQVSVLVQRTNANTNAGQGLFQILRYIGKKLGFID